MRCLQRAVLLVMLALAAAGGAEMGRNITFLVPPGESTCFIKTLSKNKVVLMEYQVINSLGDYSISFEVRGPRGAGGAKGAGGGGGAVGAGAGGGRRGGELLVPARWWPVGAHSMETTRTGEYRFCFNNSYDVHNAKTILFQLRVRWKHSLASYYYSLDGAASSDPAVGDAAEEPAPQDKPLQDYSRFSGRKMAATGLRMSLDVTGQTAHERERHRFRPSHENAEKLTPYMVHEVDYESPKNIPTSIYLK